MLDVYFFFALLEPWNEDLRIPEFHEPGRDIFQEHVGVVIFDQTLVETIEQLGEDAPHLTEKRGVSKLIV